MPTSAHVRAPAPTTAAELLALLDEFGPAVEGGELVFERDPPDDLEPALRVLHTGVRAALSGRRWYGCGNTSKTAAPRPLAISGLIPVGITLLCVEGDERWDRIHPAARLDLPGLFVPATTGSDPRPNACKCECPGTSFVG